MINVFAQSIYAQLEALAMDTNASLELFENQDYTELKTCLKASSQHIQHLLNNIGMLELLEQPSQA